LIRVLIYLLVLGAIAFGLAQVADLPGVVSIKWPWWPLYGRTLEVAPIVAAAATLGAFIAFYVVVAMLRFILRIPSIMSLTAKARRQNKGVAAVSRGMIAAGAGDARAAERAAREATKLLGPAPLALLLQAQAAQLAGNRKAAEDAFNQMKENPATRVIGLRGLYLEARRNGDEEAAYAHAQEAHTIAALPWAGQAILEKHTMGDDWRSALSVVEANIARKSVDKATGARQRAVLKTAIAQEIADREPDEALALVRESIKLAPDLVPAYALAGRLLARKGDIRRAARMIETGWKSSPHPDLAAVYIDLRPGDSSHDRLARAQTLSRLNSGHVESRLMLARTALEAREFKVARQAIAPLIENAGARPTVRTCLLMADLEETENGPSGRVREWLARAARAPRDPMWIADGLVSDRWAPASPVTGRLDAFTWETPAELLAAPEPLPQDPETPPVDLPANLPAPPPPPLPPRAEAVPEAKVEIIPPPPAATGAPAPDAKAETQPKPKPEPVPPADPKAADPKTDSAAAENRTNAKPATPAEATQPPLPPDTPAPKLRVPVGQPDDPGPR
jgi:HemY protein